MSKEVYPSVEIPQTNAHIRLLLRSTAPLTENLSLKDLDALNSAAVIAGQAGRTCYSANLQTPLDYLEKSDKYREVTDGVVHSTLEAGHLTTRQHVYYTFGIEGISRHAVYFLHSHPYSNSEMMSQRYVNLKEVSPIVPDMGSEALNQLAKDSVRDLIEGYNQIYELLSPTAKELLLERFPGKSNSRWEKQINAEAGKKSQEIARYLLPLGTPSTLYHSVSELTLLRMYHLSQTMPAQPELQQIIEGMISSVAQVDPSILNELTKPLEPETTTNNFDFSAFSQEFDTLISSSSIKLDNDNNRPSAKLARAVRLTLGKCMAELPDEAALDILLNPAKNPLLASTSGDIVLDRLGQCLNQVQFSALVSLSHVANEQFHRHRSFNHTEQLLLPIPNLETDIIVPTIFKKNERALNEYLAIQAKHIEKLHQLEDAGVPLESLQYLLTNASRVRKSITGPFGAYYHFIKARTCLTAQEEIYHMAVSLTKQISELDPLLGKYLQFPAPCGVRCRAGQTPYCPEGSRFCGVRIWNMSLDGYPQRHI